MTTKLQLSVLAAAALLAACGGGGGVLGVVAGGGSGGGSCGLSLASSAGAQPLAALTGEILLQLRTGNGIEAVAAQNNFSVVSRFGQRPIYRVRVTGSDSVDAALARLATDPRVLFAERNLQGAAPESRRCSVWAIGRADAFTTQWAPQALRLPQAQALSSGAGVRVAVLDTGIEPGHPVFSGRLAQNASGILLGRDFVDDDLDPSERGTRDNVGYGHGTHVAGLVALTAPGARIMPVRVLNENGEGNVWVLAEGLLWAIDPDGNPATDDGAHVINLSLGTLQPTRLLSNITRLANCEFDDDEDDEDFDDPGFDDDRERCLLRYGAVVSAAAGNSGSDTEQQFPAAEAPTIPGALSVTASTESRRLASFSNRGPWVQIAAPGEGITSAVPLGQFGSWSGTSMAAPIVAGVAALTMQTTSPNPLGFTGLRQWAPDDLARRVMGRTVALCGTSLRQIDALGAVTDGAGPDPVCAP